MSDEAFLRALEREVDGTLADAVRRRELDLRIAAWHSLPWWRRAWIRLKLAVRR